MPIATNKTYEGKDDEMLTIAENGWYHCGLLQAVFVAADTRYTVPFITAQQANVVTVRNMPTYQARIAAKKAFRAAMLTDLKKILSMILLFKNYISNAISNVALRDIALAAMGYNYYEVAGGRDWDVVKAMLVSANAYGAANSVMLLAAGMPATFLADLAALSVDFNSHYSSFLAESAAALVATETRRVALNAVYVELMIMFNLAQLLPLTPAQKKEFNYAYQLQAISGGPTGNRGYVYDILTGLPIAGVMVEIPSENIMVFTDADGAWEVNVRNGNYGIRFTPPSGTNYQVINDTIVVLVNTMSRRDFFMSA